MEMIKIQIKTLASSLLFEYESKENTIKKTLEKAASEKKDLTGAYLTGADLTGAYLRGAYLRGAYLRGADLTGADLTGAYLRGAYLRGAYLRGAYLRGADLTGADLTGAYLKNYKVKQASVFTGLYKYITIPFITEENEKRVVMGCHNRSLTEWENDFWNNNNEFPNNGDPDSRLRLMAFNTAKEWFKIIETTN